jgi:hypothetical protein
MLEYVVVQKIELSLREREGEGGRVWYRAEVLRAMPSSQGITGEWWKVRGAW